MFSIRRLLGAGIESGLLLVNSIAFGQKYDIDTIKNRDRLAMVYITCAYQDNNKLEEPCENGTGVIVTKDGYIVTDRHVIREWLSQSRDQQERHPIHAAIGSNHSHNVVDVEVRYAGQAGLDDDIILLKSMDSSQEYTHAPICYVKAARGGSALFVFGYPNGKDLFPAAGQFGDNNGESGYWTANIQIDHGMSGGPVYDKSGNVIALAEGGVGMLSTPSYLIPLTRRSRVY